MSSEKTLPNVTSLACPIPHTHHATVQIAHGGGGRLSARLLETLFLPLLDNPLLRQAHDGAVLDFGGSELAITTDAHVVRPLFFPGGNIGSLAVHGTINDLVMCGAAPVALSAAFILEEGFDLEQLRLIVESMGKAARQVGVPIATGDTKVVEQGHGDGVYISTTGIGRVLKGARVRPDRARPGDVVLLSGELAAHGVAVLSAREDLGLEGDIESDSASLHELVLPIIERFGERVHVLRDPTRGGVASALNEIATSAGVCIELVESQIRVSEPVRGACELFGLDPLYVANEGKCVAIVAREIAEEVLAMWLAHPLGRHAAQIGTVGAGNAGLVTLKTFIGATRVVDMMSGEQLPRIC
jgi:hydrogenase expression/formation protein HypE